MCHSDSHRGTQYPGSMPSASSLTAAVSQTLFISGLGIVSGHRLQTCPVPAEESIGLLQTHSGGDIE